MGSSPVALMVVALLALLEAERRGSLLGKAIFKPLASLGFVGVALGRLAAGEAVSGLLLAGLVLGAVGDALLIPRSRRAFVAGMGAFMAGHLCYAALFLGRGVDGGAMAVTALGLLAVGLPGMRWLWGRMDEPRLRVPVAVYAVIIGGMAATAVGTWAHSRADALLLGATLFVASDLAVARNRLIQPAFLNRLVGLPLYYAGQCLLAAWV